MDEETPPTPDDAEAALAALMETPQAFAAGLHTLTDAPLGLELERLRAGEPWCTVSVAGLQFYDYDKWDDVLSRHVMPEPGDRLALMRRPDNPADQCATEVWWRDGHHLGHVPRATAAELAPLMDRGAACRAYVLDPGDGEAWSLRALLVGAAVAGLHQREITGGLRRAVWAASRPVWGDDELWLEPYASRVGDGWRWYGQRIAHRPGRPEPSPRQRAAAKAWELRRRAAREEREAALTYAMHLLPAPRPRANRERDFAALPEGAEAPPDEALRGQTFAWWDQVPPWLATKTTLAGYRLRPRSGTVPFALIEYGSGRRHRCYELWAVADCEAKRTAPAEAGARAAEAAFWRRRRADP